MIAMNQTTDAASTLMAELQSLVRTAARRPDVVLRPGRPGCAWSFNFVQGVITVDPESLHTLAPDLCRGLALHEATHAAVTVLHDFLSDDTLTRYHPLLNCLEDIRIEVWMRQRFPGAVSWIRAYNDVFYGLLRRQPLPHSRQVQFLRGILEQWWIGSISPGTLPDVQTSLESCRTAISAATACQPPLDDDREQIVSSQQAMWRIVRDKIVPTWQRLVKADRAEGIGPVAGQELHELATWMGSGTRQGQRSGRGRQSRGRAMPNGRRVPGVARALQAASDTKPIDDTCQPPSGKPVDADAGDFRHMIRESLGSNAYLAAWRRVGPLADRLGDELLRVIMPRRRLRWLSGQSSGPRLDLRRAMQFEADPRLYNTLWSRMIVPSRREPAIVLLLDRSGSMAAGDRIGNAFDGLVLFVEVCRRIGVPAAVWSFADLPREELSFDAPLDADARQRLSKLPGSCDGQTDMTAALVAMQRMFTGHHGHGDPKLLFVLSDGEPNRPDDTLAAAERLERTGVHAVGLGLGPDTAGLSRYFRCAATGIPAAEIVGHVAGLLQNSFSL